MTKIWRAVGWIVLALLAAGLVLGGIGWLTGASPIRMIDVVFGGVDAAKAAAANALDRAVGLWNSVVADVIALF